MRKRDLSKIGKRSVHKRKKKESARAALLSAINEVGVNADGAKIRIRSDLGRRARVSHKAGGDETVAVGVYSSSRSGFGFVKTEESKKDIFIPEGKTLGAIDGDVVEIVYHLYTDRFGEERSEGRVRKILEFGRKTVIGTLDEEYIRHGRKRYRTLVVIPDEQRIMAKAYVGDAMDAQLGDKVEALIKRGSGNPPECDVVRVFGDAESKDANYEAILADEGIIQDFSPAELDEAKRLSEEPLSLQGRVDRTGETIFTIDGEGAKDLDDAVSLRKIKDGYRLGVHIADVSHYVREKSALERCAMARGTSVYFTDKVVPMLPEALSNGACSLNFGEDKYVLSAIIDLDGEGNIKALKLEESVIRSKVRGVYSEVNRLLSGEGDAELRKKYSSVMPTLRKMQELYLILRKKSEKRGAIDFDAPEAEIVLGEDGFPVDIGRRERGVAERIIEQFMLTANEAVATHLYEREIPCVYRIHEAPPEDKLEAFVNYAHALGFDATVITKDRADAHALSGLLSAAEERGLLAPVSYSMLRAMAKARYSEVRSSHFGLGIENYCHFTSPIRRLSDLATHRIIKKVLFEGKRAQQYASFAKRAAAAATEAELRAVSAERRIDDLYKAIYMSDKIGEIYPATVSSVTSFGLFCELDNTVEGLVPISELDGFFTYEEKTVSMVSRDKIYRLADRVTVRVEEADVQRGKIRFSIVGGDEE